MDGIQFAAVTITISDFTLDKEFFQLWLNSPLIHSFIQLAVFIQMRFNVAYCVFGEHICYFFLFFFFKRIFYTELKHTLDAEWCFIHKYILFFFNQDQRHFNGIEWPTANTITLALPFECNPERKKQATNIFFGIMCARASKLWWRCVFNKYFVDHSSSSCIVLFVCLFVCDEIKSNGTSERGVWLLNGWRDYREKDN